MDDVFQTDVREGSDPSGRCQVGDVIDITDVGWVLSERSSPTCPLPLPFA